MFDPATASHGHVAGLSRELILAWRYNGDARTQSLTIHPESKEKLVEKTLGSNPPVRLTLVVSRQLKKHHRFQTQCNK